VSARYLALRLAQVVFVAFGVTVATFGLLHLVPGNPARTLLGVHATAGEVAYLSREWGLTKPLPVQYADYVGRLLHGDLGTSVYYQAPVAGLIGHALPVTLSMLALGAAFGIAASVPLALLAATRPGRPADHVIRAVPMAGLGMPPFWVGFILLIVFALGLHLLPAGGYGSTPAGHLESLILPGLTVAAVTTPILVRSLRLALIEVLGSEFVAAATARGLSRARVLLRHALRSTAVPAVSVLAVNLGYLLGGTVVIENVFGLPGVGNLLLTGILNRDFDVVQSVTLVYALLVVLINLGADLAYAALDPRVVLGR
jgi:peptide/nickel transport system permease protein